MHFMKLDPLCDWCLDKASFWEHLFIPYKDCSLYYVMEPLVYRF